MAISRFEHLIYTEAFQIETVAETTTYLGTNTEIFCNPGSRMPSEETMSPLSTVRSACISDIRAREEYRTAMKKHLTVTAGQVTTYKPESGPAACEFTMTAD